MQGLEDALHSCGIDRQAYHGRTFIGNHVHKCLRVSHHQSCKYVYNNYYSIDSIEVYSVPQYNIIIDQEYTATDSCSTETAAKLNTLKDEAAAIRTTFEQLLNSFASCNSYCSLQCNYYLYYKTTILCRYKCWHIPGILPKVLSRCHHYPKATYAWGPYGPMDETLALGTRISWGARGGVHT